MRINLSGGDIRVAQECLDRAKISTVFYHVSSAAVTEHVRAGVPSGLCRGGGDHLPNSLAGDSFPALREEKQRRALPPRQY